MFERKKHTNAMQKKEDSRYIFKEDKIRFGKENKCYERKLTSTSKIGFNSLVKKDYIFF